MFNSAGVIESSHDGSVHEVRAPFKDSGLYPDSKAAAGDLPALAAATIDTVNTIGRVAVGKAKVRCDHQR